MPHAAHSVNCRSRRAAKCQSAHIEGAVHAEGQTRGRGIAMSDIKTEFLFGMTLDLEISILGDTPLGIRRIARLNSGRFEGPRLSGTVLPGGGGWMLVRRDDVLEIDMRVTLDTTDRQQIYMHWRGLRHGPKDVIARLASAENVDPAAYYFRTTPYFETSSDRYSWLNRICAIGTGSVAANERILNVYEVL
jgi:Protein of unknown function (DUF3237)